jgi:hypothetical protein
MWANHEHNFCERNFAFIIIIRAIACNRVVWHERTRPLNHLLILMASFINGKIPISGFAFDSHFFRGF